jgi:hypothetical protein
MVKEKHVHQPHFIFNSTTSKKMLYKHLTCTHTVAKISLVFILYVIDKNILLTDGARYMFYHSLPKYYF